MKKLAALVFAASMLAGSAFADTIENNYANTFVVTAGAEVIRYTFNADGTFTATPASGAAQSGRYEVAGEQVCFLGAENQRQCAPIVSGKNVGDTWQQLDANGNQISITLEAGRQ